MFNKTDEFYAFASNSKERGNPLNMRIWDRLLRHFVPRKNASFGRFSSHSFAFTLAEVLITLGIIGVVAALTIPTLMNNVGKNQTVTTLEKTYSTLAQAIKLSEIDNGPVSNWTFTPDGTASIANTHTFLNNYLVPYFKSMNFCSDGDDKSNTCGTSVSGAGANYTLVNGVGFSILALPTAIFIVIDVNGVKKPNSMGKDVFFFDITHTDGLVPHNYVKGMTRAQIINDGSNGCTTATISYPKHSCTALIYYDGWKISDDYPW